MIRKGKKPFTIRFVKSYEAGKSDYILPVYSTLYERIEPISSCWLNSLANRDRSNSKIAKASDLTIFFEWYEKELGSLSANILSLSPPPIYLAESLLKHISTPLTGKTFLSPETIRRRSSTIAQFLRYSYSQVASEKAHNVRSQKCIDDLNLFIRIICRPTYSRKEESTNRTNHEEVCNVITSLIKQSEKCVSTSAYTKHVRDTCIVWLLAETGIRRSELCTLTLDSIEINSSRPSITVRSNKSPEVSPRRQITSVKTRGRTLPISRRLALLLEEYVDNCRNLIRERSHSTWSTYLFLSLRDGAPMSPSTIYSIVSCAFDQHSTLKSKVSPHDLRTYSISRLREQAISTSNDGNLWIGKDIVSYVGGWSPTGQMAAYYTKSVVRHRLNELADRIYKEWKW